MSEETAPDAILPSGPNEEQAEMIADFKAAYPGAGIRSKQRPEPCWEAYWLDSGRKAHSLEGGNLAALIAEVTAELREREPDAQTDI